MKKVLSNGEKRKKRDETNTNTNVSNVSLYRLMFKNAYIVLMAQ